MKSYRICIRNQTRNQDSVCPLISSPDIDVQTLKCPAHTTSNDVITVVLQMTDGGKQDLTEFVRFIVPGIVEHEDNNKTYAVKTALINGFELAVEYRRNRIDSRNKHDLQWELLHAFIHIREKPDVLSTLLEYLREEYSYGVLLEERDMLQKGVETDMKDERRLQLALLDVKASLSAKRKQQVQVEKAMISAIPRYEACSSALDSILNTRYKSEKIDSI